MGNGLSDIGSLNNTDAVELNNATTKNQYAIRPGGRYEAVGEVKEGLPPGFYQIQCSFFATYFKQWAGEMDDLIDLPGSPADVAFADMLSFLKMNEQYKKAGLTHKRGYLFFGPPGTGKTSLAVLLGHKVVNAGGLVVIPGSSENLKRALDVLRQTERNRAIMFVLEELPSILSNSNEDELLSILDGEESMENTIFVATTNYIDELEPRIRARPGRFDMVMEIGNLDSRVRYGYAKKVLSRFVSADKVESVAKDVTDATDAMSLAHIREVIIASQILQRESIKEASERLRKDIVASEEAEEDDDDPSDS